MVSVIEKNPSRILSTKPDAGRGCPAQGCGLSAAEDGGLKSRRLKKKGINNNSLTFSLLKPKK
jgi:hypothetical protein